MSSIVSSRYKNEGFENDERYLVNFTAGSSGNSPSNSPTPECHLRYTDSRSHMIIEVPVSQLKKIKTAEGTVSVKRETQHFCETTTMHGPKRIFQGKRWATLFWFVMVSCSLGLLITQVVILASEYLSKPTVSDVSFLINEDGMDFPLVTVCNLNPIRKSYIREMNKTGDVHPEMINYLMQWFTEIATLVGSSDRQNLHEGNQELQEYQNKHPNFTADQFFMEAGFDCSDVVKLCTFQGELFDCCSLTTPILTPLGKCFTLDLSKSPKANMHKQTEPGIQAGLAITLDAHLEEQFDGSSDSMDALFTNSFVDGFRYFVHPPNTIPHLASDEFTVSPNSVAYSAISSDRYVLLPSHQWGNCTDDYPKGINSDLPYSSGNCLALCKAKYFLDNCGCTPALYNIENRSKECTPYETFTCIDTKLSEHNKITGKLEYQPPSCTHCAQQCNSLVFRAYNSYGSQFSAGAFNWLRSKNSNWTVGHMKANFQMINIFYRDMAYTEYNQVQDASITQLLSDIGGNMGMFLGMSVITITEICLFFSKVFWLGLSKKRRDYMYSKRINEKTHEREVCETVEKMKVISSNGNLANLIRTTGGAMLRAPKENVEFRIDLKDLANHLDSDSDGYSRREEGLSRSSIQKY
uniref:Amiloride-sensitive sodium channel n=1 Tax=Caenorhabditis tropicalis TaxID=1561998 RepID=A0A1I7TK36_9PELO